MKFRQLDIADVYLITPDKLADERGFFARLTCAKEMGAVGLASNFPQTNVSFNKKKGTFRGLHFQDTPKGEVKIIRCTRGAIYDIVLDLRPDSPTYLKWIGTELNSDTHTSIYVPIGCAHGFQTLADDTEVHYLMGELYDATLARGVRYNDPAIKIRLPRPVSAISERDLSYPELTP